MLEDKNRSSLHKVSSSSRKLIGSLIHKLDPKEPLFKRQARPVRVAQTSQSRNDALAPIFRYQFEKHAVLYGHLICLSIALMVTASILVICLTSPKEKVNVCKHEFDLIFVQNIERPTRAQALAVGHFDHDQHSDIVTSNHDSDNIAILFGSGNGQLSNPIILSTGKFSRPSFVVVHDFNNDANDDIILTLSGTNSIGIFLGRGNRTFSEPTFISTGQSRPLSMAIGDFNGDRRWDLAVVQYGTNSVGIVMGLDSGTFKYSSTYSTGYDSDPRSIAAAHLNDDIHLDLIVSNYGTNNIGLFFGNGNGTFASQKLFSTGRASKPYFVAIGDLNYDNRSDIIVANSGTDSIVIFFGNNKGIFDRRNTLSTGIGSQPHAIAIGDLNGDHNLDIAVANSGSNDLVIFFGDRNGLFNTSALKHSTGLRSEPQHIVLNDFNSDGLIDIAVVNNGTNDVGILTMGKVLKFSIKVADEILHPFRRDLEYDIKFSNKINIQSAMSNISNDEDSLRTKFINRPVSRRITARSATIYPCFSMITADFNNDKQMDIIKASSLTKRLEIFLGHGNGSLFNSFYVDRGWLSAPCAIAVADFNNDGAQDTVVTDQSSETIYIFIGNGAGSFSDENTYLNFGTNRFAYSTVAGDWNCDNRSDIAVVYATGLKNIHIFFGYGDGSFTSGTTYSTGLNSYSVAIEKGDVNNDKKMDLIVVNHGVNTLSILIGDGNGTFTQQIVYPIGDRSYPISVSIFDCNNDNYQDLVIANYGTHRFSQLDGYVQVFSVGVILNRGNGSFAPIILYPTGYDSRPAVVLTGDFNNDSSVDIAVGNFGPKNIGVFLGLGNGSFSKQTTYSIEPYSAIEYLIAADFNEDRRTDIILNTGSSIVFLFSYDEILVKTMKKFETGQNRHSYSLVITDLNHDTNPDLIAANPESNGISIGFGYGNLSFSTEYEILCEDDSFTRSVISADLNNDRAVDLVVTNTASNSIGVFFGHGDGTLTDELVYSTGANSQPFSAAINDLNNDGSLDIAFVNYGSHTTCVLLRYDAGDFELHTLFSKLNDHAFTKIALEDFNNDNRTDIAVINYPNFSMDILLQSDNLSLINIKRYSLMGYPSSIAVADLNQDHNVDIVLTVQGSSILVGAEAVIVYIGYGNGTFIRLNSYSTGDLSNPCSAKTTDLNNDDHLDIVIANTDSSNIWIFLGNGDGSFLDQIILSTGVHSRPISLVVADFNSDNRNDIAVADNSGHAIKVFLNVGNGSFADFMTHSTGIYSEPTSIEAGDLNNDHLIDIVVANGRMDTVGVFIGYGNGSFKDQVLYPTGSGSYPYYVTVANVNHDRHIDIVVVNRNTASIGIFLGIGRGLFTNQRIFPTNGVYFTSDVAITDWNNDHRLDLLVIDSANIYAFIGLPRDDFIAGMNLSNGADSFPRSLYIKDCNNDNKSDIFVANSGSDSIGIFMGFGDGYFDDQYVYATGYNSQPFAVVVEDVNSDLKQDIIYVNYGAESVTVLLGHGNGTFYKFAIYSTGSMSQPTSIGLADMNKDAHLDVVVTNSASNTIMILYGLGNGMFGDRKVIFMGYASNPIWLTLADINNDNFTDIAVVNSGFRNIAIFTPTCS